MRGRLTLLLAALSCLTFPVTSSAATSPPPPPEKVCRVTMATAQSPLWSQVVRVALEKQRCVAGDVLFIEGVTGSAALQAARLCDMRKVTQLDAAVAVCTYVGFVRELASSPTDTSQ